MEMEKHSLWSCWQLYSQDQSQIKQAVLKAVARQKGPFWEGISELLDQAFPEQVLSYVNPQNYLFI